MLNKVLKIELCSDLISASGESYGNVIDTDTIHDQYGFPYIPSKRIKGLMKEAMLELEDFLGDTYKGLSNKIFGDDQNDGHHFIIHNAYLNNYEEMKEEVANISKDYKKYVQPTHIMDYYTIIRYQTAIENNTAKEGSLRSMRAVAKGNVFYAYVECLEEDFEVLSQCIKLVTHMGLNRTRGFGEVKLSFEDAKQTSLHYLNNIEDDKDYCVTLHLENKSQLSITGFEGEKTLDYIPGSSFRGYFANHYLKSGHEDDSDFYRLFIQGDIQFSNAYISDMQWNEYAPVKESLFKQKVGSDFYDKTSIDYKDSDEIISKVRNKYSSLTDTQYVKDVEKEMSYHHRRPDDKSIGHAISNAMQGQGTFYQVETMSPNQRFIAHIYGKGKDLKQAMTSIPEMITVGKSKNSQYGHVEVCKVEVKQTTKKVLSKGQQVTVRLKSPLLLLDKKGESMLSVEDLCKALHIELDENKENSTFVGYKKIGGYNSKWKLQMPSYVAFSAGTCLVGTLQEDVEDTCFIGNNNAEGLGEVIYEAVKTVKVQKASYNHTGDKKPNYTTKVVESSIYQAAMYDLIEDIQTSELGKKDKSINNTTIGKVLLLISSTSWDEFKKQIDLITMEKEVENEKDKKKKAILEYCKKIEAKVDEKLASKEEYKKYLSSKKKQLYLDTLKEAFLIKKYEGRK